MFCFFAFLIVILIPISITFIYSDIMVYKTHITPIITENLSEWTEV